MRRQDVLKRAHAAIRMPIRYKLGAGGRDPKADSPGDLCDCSGFVAWCFGIDRLTEDPFYLSVSGGWMNTDAMVADSKSPRGFLEPVPVGQARPGDLMVFGKSARRKYGHVGIITQTISGRPTRVIHCSAANAPTAVRETDPSVFVHNDAVIVRHKDAADLEPQRPPLTMNLDILATEFGGGDEAGMPSAYGGRVNPNEPQAALPARVAASRRWLVVENPENGKRVRCLVNDVGPWNTADPYWDNNDRPAAEEQHRDGKRAQNKRVPTNAAGIDLTPAVFDAIGVKGKINTRRARVNWWFE